MTYDQAETIVDKKANDTIPPQGLVQLVNEVFDPVQRDYIPANQESNETFVELHRAKGFDFMRYVGPQETDHQRELDFENQGDEE